MAEVADTSKISIDSTFVKVHQSALIGRPIRINLSEENINDSVVFEKQIAGFNLKDVTVLADRAYSTYNINEVEGEK